MDNATTLSVARIVIGASSWATPARSLRLAMLDHDAPQSPYLLRLFAVREVALGAATLIASGSARSNLLRIGLAVDAADAVSAVLAANLGGVSKPKGALLTAAALTGLATGAMALLESKQPAI